MCLNPRWIYKKGNYKENNYRGMKGDFYELGTYAKCSVCEQCVAEKSNNWVIRNYYEEKAHTEKCFITLTYKENPYFLIKKDLQDFIKRFRYEINKEYYEKLKNVRKALKGEQLQQWKEKHKNEFIKTRIFYAGEYGTQKGRPHYHIIIYGWEDKNIEYLNINKKKNILYKSKLIEKTWGKGRTTYQKFNNHEIPYIALYNTPKEEFSKAYKMTLEKARKLRPIIRSNSCMSSNQRKNILKELSKIEEELTKNKKEYYLIKEFNGWSVALGWEEFEKEYYKTTNYIFKEYIEQCEYVTPTPWVKKLANMGDIAAAEEMYRREEEIEQSANEIEEATKNKLRLEQKRKKEHKEWHEQGRKNGEIEEL